MRQILSITCRWMVLIALVPALSAIAQIPGRFAYQGFLTTPSGVPVSATLQVEFSMWDQPVGGVQVWTESQTVPVANGMFNIVLGSVNAIAVTFDKPYYLELKVGTDAPMAPRQSLTSVPYAESSRTATCDDGDMISCYAGAASTLGVGTCKAGTRTCNSSTRTYGPCVGQITPSAELPDGLDNDCNGQIDNGAYANGAACASALTCASGNCVDGVCCNATCAGSCRACDLPGTAGTCTNVANGSDPDNECGSVSCTNFYWGWSGNGCYRRADVPAASSFCNGAGACQSQAQACSQQTSQGSVQATCHATCQSPNLTTCTGTTAGTCTNINPGTQTCGVGACQRTVSMCSNGAPLACAPGQPTSEVCNGVDDDCDGQVDEGVCG